MYQSVLVHHAETRTYRPGQEDAVRGVVSSVDSDAGIFSVIYEPQDDPAMYQVPAPAWRGAAVRKLVARLRAALGSGRVAEQWGRSTVTPD